MVTRQQIQAVPRRKVASLARKQNNACVALTLQAPFSVSTRHLGRLLVVGARRATAMHVMLRSLLLGLSIGTLSSARHAKHAALISLHTRRDALRAGGAAGLMGSGLISSRGARGTERTGTKPPRASLPKLLCIRRVPPFEPRVRLHPVLRYGKWRKMND